MTNKELKAKVEMLEQAIEGLGGRVDSLTNKLESIANKVDGIERRVSILYARNGQKHLDPDWPIPKVMSDVAIDEDVFVLDQSNWKRII